MSREQSPKVIRSSMGYGMRFPVLETTWPDWIQFHKAQTSGRVTREHVFLAEAPQNTDTGRTYYSADLRVSPLVLVIGSESVGISDEVGVVLIILQLPLVAYTCCILRQDVGAQMPCP